MIYDTNIIILLANCCSPLWKLDIYALKTLFGFFNQLLAKSLIDTTVWNNIYNISITEIYVYRRTMWTNYIVNRHSAWYTLYIRVLQNWFCHPGMHAVHVPSILLHVTPDKQCPLHEKEQSSPYIPSEQATV